MRAREVYMESTGSACASQYEKHQIISHDDVSWLIGPEGKLGNCWCEIRCLYGKSLLVHGDIGPLLFAYGPENPTSRVLWMADRPSAADHYFVEKAHIGMGGRELLEKWNTDVAVDDIVEMLTEHYEEVGMTDEGNELLNDVRATPSMYDDWSCQVHLTELLQDHGFGDWLNDCGFGHVPSTRMFHAHAALARLGHLLRTNAQ